MSSGKRHGTYLRTCVVALSGLVIGLGATIVLSVRIGVAAMFSKGAGHGVALLLLDTGWWGLCCTAGGALFSALVIFGFEHANATEWLRLSGESWRGQTAPLSWSGTTSARKVQCGTTSRRVPRKRKSSGGLIFLAGPTAPQYNAKVGVPGNPTRKTGHPEVLSCRCC